MNHTKVFRQIAILLLNSILLFPGIVFCQQDSPQNFDSIKVVKPGATLVQVAKQFSFTEGPAAIPGF